MNEDTRILYVRMPEAMHKRLRVAAAKARRPIAPLTREAVERYPRDDGGIERLRHPARSGRGVSPGLVHAQPGPRVGERGECALRGGALPGCAPEVPRGAGRRARVAGDPLQRRETPRVVAGRHVWGLTYRIVTRSWRCIRTSPSGNPRGPRGPSRLNSGRAPAESRSARRAHTLARLHEKRAPSRR